ncbi:serine/threonine protein kinase [Kribbella orskensis]|uniref:non-specific serine/threonine protein kinase n=1 Tax=Kribbella orskensis TaxID=2512216 RepID=A0ABY2BIQ4_9ACTN|nr:MULTISPECIES: serine/threonine-protein kinase [Kribbella]TCN39084.1 serine/threonine protein kinase [Kribbella sp. VKM Ac-2500]TCO21731.1 serine/threonine protein kinase [Kribbella orskensis]
MDQPPRIGRYSLVRRVGAGGFATVWLARDEQLDADVAVKILSDNWIDQDDVRRRFLAEGRFLRRVDSPHVVGVHDIGETEDGRPYLVLTYADGGSLADRIKAGPLEIDEAVDVITQVGSGLKQLHARGVLHRDVKPANVLFRTDPAGDRAMLGDLGLGKSLETVSQLTMPGGTPAYVAPEQVMGDRLDQRADLYSLGAVAYAAFTGQAPHGVISLGAVMRIDAPPPSMTTLRADVSDAIDVVVRRALEPDRDKRWPDLDSFLTALREAHTTGKIPANLVPAEDLPGPTTPAPVDQETALSEANAATIAAVPPTEVAPEPRRSRRAWVFAALAAIVLAAAGGYGGYQFVLSRPVTVTDATERLSVEVPREWNQKAEGNPELPQLLVSTDTQGWQASDAVPGVYLGVENKTALPTTAQPPVGCQPDGAGSGDPVDDKRAVTYTYQCTDDLVIDRYVLFSDSQSVRIEVRGSDRAELQKVLDSATYR